jgi:LPPG:FO 2-phospho-L-lactate transferase
MNKAAQKVVALTGGSGGAKLVHGLAQILPPEQLTIIVNTGDDFEHLGLTICPDLDKVMYTLANASFPGQGLKNESWNMMAAMARYQGPRWYQLGDRDLATQLLRSHWLREGYPLNWVTKELARRLGVRYTILPMSEAPVRTMVQTARGEVGLQEYVLQKQPPEPTGLRYDGAEQAEPSREVMSAVREADMIIFGPSNPVLSFGPPLAMPNLRRILVASRAPKVAVSCYGGHSAADGPVDKIMRVAGMDPSSPATAQYLREVLTHFVLDHHNETQQDQLTDLGLRTLVTGIVMHGAEDQKRLAQEVLDFVQL